MSAWLHSDEAIALFAEAGLSHENFSGLIGIYKSEFTGRIVVMAYKGLVGDPLLIDPPYNLVKIERRETGIVEFYFDGEPTH